MNKENKKLKSPKELFEEKRLKSLEELQYQKIEEEKKDKKILSPKQYFNEVVEQPEEQLKEEYIQEEGQNKEIEELKNKILELQESISDKADLVELIQLVGTLKDRIDNVYNSNDYSNDITNINEEIVNIRNQILVFEKFDSSELYENISELKSKIEEVRSEIPTIPKPILYDNELNELKDIIKNLQNNINSFPKVKYYDEELNDIINTIDEIRTEIPILPEIKYYDDDIDLIENKLIEIENSIPEVKYYDDDIKLIENKLIEIENSIPEVKYYDDEVSELENKITDVKESIPEVKYYDAQIDDLKNEIGDVKKSIPEVKYYDKDVSNLKNKIEEVKKLIPSVPEIKYYDEELDEINSKIKTLFEEVSSIEIPDENFYIKEIKEIYSSFEDKNNKLLRKIKYLEEVFDNFNEQNILQEGLLSEPPEVKNSDPLTPLNQNFVTFDQLKEHYRLFINRIQQQLSTIGGGGETRLEFLDDVDRNSAKQNGYVLQWNSSVGKFIGTSYVSGSGSGVSDNNWIVDAVGINTTKKVGIGTTAKNNYQLYVQDNAKISNSLEVSGLAISDNTIDVGISSLTINAGYISVASSIIPSEDGVFELGSADKQWKAIHVFGSTIFLDGVPLQLSDNTVSIGGTNLVLKPELDNLELEVNFLSTGIQLVGYFDASVGIITHLTSYGEEQGIYIEGHSLPSSGISTGNYFIVSKSGNNVGIATFVTSGISTAYTGDWIGATSSSTWAVLSYSDSQIVPIANDALNFDNKPASYYLNYNNLNNRPTNLSQFNNNVGFITSGGTLNTTGIVTATKFIGDGSGLTNIIATGTGITLKNDNNLVGMALTVNFSNNFSTTVDSPGTISIDAALTLSDLTNVTTTGVADGYIMVYDAALGKFKFVDPKTIGINNDFNPDPEIDDYGTY